MRALEERAALVCVFLFARLGRAPVDQLHELLEHLSPHKVQNT